MVLKVVAGLPNELLMEKATIKVNGFVETPPWESHFSHKVKTWVNLMFPVKTFPPTENLLNIFPIQIRHKNKIE